MSYKLKRERIANGVYFSSVSDTKFKHNRLSVNFILPLTRDNVTESVIVPFILKQGFKDCKTYKELSRKLDSLYGASLDCDISKFGANHILSLSVVGLDDRYALLGENLTGELARLLDSVIFSPIIENGELDVKITEREKENLLDTIKSEINDKRSYAVAKCIEIMFDADEVALKKYGYEDKAEQITAKLAAQAYEYMLKKAEVEIMFVGCGESEEARKVLEESFKSVEREPEKKRKVNFTKARKEVKNVREIMDVSQGKLVIGFKTGEVTSTEKKRALRVMTAMFGGTPVSLLFKNVREKMSLCYYCAARYNETTGVILVDSGVEAQNKDKAYKEILNQLDMIKKGEFTDEDLLHTKLILATALKSTTDALWSTENWYLSQILSETQISPEEELEMFNAISRKQIIEAANCVELDSVYLLSRDEQ